ncbi:MBL fold metallo-hydrolase [Ferrimonas pelagia]|uniref:beta-lactamase n=1 Tax=Ferrimonas pelagia TaxID=1177826 RepID=A0ABP9FFG5_9GAMM
MLRLIPLLLLIVSASIGASGEHFAQAEIRSQKLAEGIFMLTGQGGNIGVSAGKDGLLIIDDQFAPLADKIQAELNTLHPASAGRPDYVINTHHHSDHTGGNRHFAQQGVLMAHRNVRRHLQSEGETDVTALPVLTFEQGLELHYNGDTVRIMHLGPGHTDGDAVILFEQANVLHMGDLMFKDRFPYIDHQHGGSVRAYLQRIEQVLPWCDDDTKIIPGHGDLADRQDLARFMLMLQESLDWAQQMSGQPEAQWHQQGLPSALENWSWSFISQERWIDTLWRELQEY